MISGLETVWLGSKLLQPDAMATSKTATSKEDVIVP